MDPLIQILRYMFEKQNIECSFDSIESFFDDGKSFPLFISMIFNFNEIPDVKENPESPSDKKHNNDYALQYLFQNNEYIQKSQPKYDSIDDKNNLLSLIFTKQCFKLDHQKIIDKCNKIVQSFEVHYNSEEEFLQFQTLFSILHVLTDGEVQENPEINDQILTENFEIAQIPLILNENSLEKQNQYQFYIQIQIIFDIYSKKIKSIRKSSQLSSQSSFSEFKDQDDNKSIQKVQSSDISESSGLLEDGTKLKKKRSGFFRFRRKRENSSESEDSTQYYSDDENDEKENEELQNEALLKTINAIGKKGGIHFEDFEEAVKNDAIPKFVMYFFNISSIEKVNISNEPKLKSRSEHLSKEQLDNIDSVIEFIKTKKEKFKILHFDFEDLMNIEASTILFYTNFLNCFFLKKLKQEMYQRTVRLLCTHTSRFNENYNNLLFTKFKIYPCLLHFLTKGDLHFNFNYHKTKMTNSIVENFFKDAKIPMIINKELLQYGKKYASFPIFYQLQFIFDALDSAPKTRLIIEIIMNVLFELKRIEVPKIVEMASSIKAKRLSLKRQSQIGNKYRTQETTQNYLKKEKVVISMPKTFSERCKEDENYLTKLKESITTFSNKKEEFVQFSQFWNSPDPDYSFDNGIIYNQKESKINKAQSQTDWINEISNIQKNINKRERKTISTKNDKDIIQIMKFNFRKSSNFESRLHKLFIYDETENIWKLNENGFKQFSEEKQININNSKTPLILYLNSNEKDLISMNSNLINGIYPNLDSIDESSQEIFIYAICERSLTMLNYTVDFNNAEKASIKPVFLLLHVPKNKENLSNIRLIVTQIYSFLSTICDFEVTVLNKDHYLDQIEYIKNILMLNKIHDNLNQLKKFPFSFSYQEPNSSSNTTNLPDSFDIIYKEPKFVVLVNEPTVSFKSEIDENLNKNEFFKGLLSKIDKETHLHFINVDDSDTYECYLNCMNDIIMNNNCCLFNEIEKNFNEIGISNFTDKYLQIMINDNYYDILEKAIMERLNMLSTLENDPNTNIDEKFKEEIEKIAPKNKFFITDCYSIKNLFGHDDCCNESIRKILKENINLSSESHLSFINQSINQKYYWKIQKMADMIDSHKRFLKNELFSLIQNLISDDLIEKAFEFNFDIIQNQIEKDRSKIMEIIGPFLEKIDIKGRTKVHDLRNTMKEGTNYTMKETENLREIKVAVKINQDLKSEIDQDF